MHRAVVVALLALQCFTVLFVALHNWIPLGTFNDVKRVRTQFPGLKLVTTTLVNLVPAAVGLAGSSRYFGRAYPKWLGWWLGITYGLACSGSLKAWWIPYLSKATPERVKRHRAMYVETHAFLPELNGFRPNTLHILFDVATIAILLCLAILIYQR